MSPESVFVTNPIAEPDEETFSDYLGGLRLERNRQTKRVDPMSVPDNAAPQALFWEAITDWIAEFSLGDELSREEQEEIATSGYFERHWIGYLVRKSPDNVELVRAMKESYATGYDDALRGCLQKQLRAQDDHFYDELLKIIGRRRTDGKRVDD